MPHPVKYWSYLERYQADRPAVLAALDEAISGGCLVLGPRVEAFEKAFASYGGTAHGIGVNSGTDALFLGLKALDVGPGDEVITVSNTAVPTVAAIRATGARPVFVDIDPATFLMDAARVEERITPQTRVLLPVHLFGQMAPMTPLLEIAKRHNLQVVEDCAQATGARQAGQPAGSLGHLSAFSFYPTKVLGGYGDGGMMLTASDELAARLRRLRFYGIERDYHSVEEGYNSRLDVVQATLLHQRLGSLDERIRQRQHLASLYTEGLKDVGDIVCPKTAPGNEHVFYVYTIRTAQRDALRQHLAEQSIGAQVNYPTPIHRMRGYSFLGLEDGALPATERASREILSLPMYPELTPADVEVVVSAVRMFFAGGRRHAGC